MSTDSVTAEQVARALDNIAKDLVKLATWVENVRLIVLELPSDTPIRRPQGHHGTPPPVIDMGGCMPKISTKTSTPPKEG